MIEIISFNVQRLNPIQPRLLACTTYIRLDIFKYGLIFVQLQNIMTGKVGDSGISTDSLYY